MPDSQEQITQLQHQLQQLEQRLSSLSINLDTQIIGMFQVVSVAPTTVPRTAYDQIQIYTNSTTYRLYWYDWHNQAWRYATGT